MTSDDKNLDKIFAILNIAEEALNDDEKYPGNKIVFSNRALRVSWKCYTYVSSVSNPSVDAMLEKAFTNAVRRLIQQADEVKSLEYKLMFVGRALKYMDQNDYHLDITIRGTLVECLRKEVSHEVFVDLALKYIDSR
jgi:hypothetical protein